jgi:O-antigen/teichoic acid export membrane protein
MRIRVLNSLMQPVMILLGSNFIGLVVGGFFFLIAAKNFGLDEMGVYGLAISIQAVFTGFIGNGISVATVRLASDYLDANDNPAAAGIAAYSIIIPAGLCIIAAVICYGLSEIGLSGEFLQAGMLLMVALWAGGASVLVCIKAGLLAQRNYKMAGLLTVLRAVTGLLSLIIVLISGPLTVRRLLVAHIFGLGSGAILGVGFLLPLWRKGINLSVKLFFELYRYARWPALSEGIRILQANLGPFLLVAVSGPEQVGLFSLARYPAFIFGMVAISFYQYWLPEVTRQKGVEELIRFLRRQMKLAGIVGGGMVIGAIALRPLLPALGSNFAAAAPLFILCTLDFVVFLLIRPIETVYHGVHKPHFELVLRVVRLPLLVGFGFFLASKYGAVGMAWANLFSSLAVVVVAIWMLFRHLGSFPFIWNILNEKKSTL